MPTLEDVALRKQIRRKLKLDIRTAILGDDQNPSRVRVPGRSAYVYVRYPASNNNTSSLSWPTIVKMIVNIDETPGTPVLVKYDDEGELAVVALSTKALESNGTEGGRAVIHNPVNDWVDMGKSPLLRSQPMGASAPLFVSVLPYNYIDSDKIYHEFSGVSGGVDLSSYLPTNPNEWCLAGLFLKQTDDTVEVVTSTAQDLAEPLTAEDIQECIDGSTDLSIFICCWILRYGQASIADTDKFTDGRQWINIPQDTTGGTDTDAVHVNVPAEINGITAKATPISGDVLLIEDSADSYNKKSITIGDLPGGGSGSATVLLNYHPSTDLASIVALTANNWTDLHSNQSFTVLDSSDIITVSVSGAAYIGTTVSSNGARVIIDSAGTPVTYVFGGGFTGAGIYSNVLSGATFQITGLSAGSHTIKVQVNSVDNNNNLICQPSTRPNSDSLTILIMEYGS